MEIVNGKTGEVMSEDDIEFAYTREGRHELGQEFPNPVPMAPPIGFVPQPPIWEQIRAMVQRELGAQRAGEDAETFDEADDFDVGDDYDPSTPYEETFEPDLPWPPSKAVEAAEAEAVNAKADVDRLRQELAEAEKKAGVKGAATPPSEGGKAAVAPSEGS